MLEGSLKGVLFANSEDNVLQTNCTRLKQKTVNDFCQMPTLISRRFVTMWHCICSRSRFAMKTMSERNSSFTWKTCNQIIFHVVYILRWMVHQLGHVGRLLYIWYSRSWSQWRKQSVELAGTHRECFLLHLVFSPICWYKHNMSPPQHKTCISAYSHFFRRVKNLFKIWFQVCEWILYSWVTVD